MALIYLLITACAPAPKEYRWTEGATTYGKFLIPATKGDAKSQNLIGYMLYFGEGVSQDQEGARVWFGRAAEQGHPTAQLNLAIISTLNADGPLLPSKDQEFYAAAQETSSPADGDPALTLNSGDVAAYIEQMKSSPDGGPVPGQARYESFCAGCHGLNGIAAYVHSPSFAIGERLHKTDGELLRSISDGRGRMPGWAAMLTQQELLDLLFYVRSFPERYRRGIAGGVRPIPGLYYTFGPMRDRELGEAGEP